MLRYCSFVAGLLILFAGFGDDGFGDDRPNIVWIIADDLSPELGCYGYPEVATPNLDRLASQGVRYDLAFATAPVCSPSRTAFQTGQYQTTVGGHHHDTRIKPELLKSAPTVTELMQQAGYFVCNGVGLAKPEKRIAKSHFNFAYNSREFFDGHDWTQRSEGQPEGQPFFATIQIKEPHRPFVQRSREYPDAPIPGYYPEHPVTRADWGDYLASIEVLDQKVGEVLKRLESEGLAENTLVLFFGDHGRPHVRDKQWLYEGGLRVPLLARWPGKIEPGTVDDRMVSLIDLMPTTLAVADVEVPSGVKLPGRNLLDSQWNGHSEIYAARDRCGEAIDRIRSVRTRRWKYIRNFHPEKPYMQHSSYKRLSYPVDALMRVLHKAGQWDSPFMDLQRPSEELYDLNEDPEELKNLANDPGHQEVRRTMRSHLDQWIVATNDQGRVDESLAVDMEALKAGKWKWFEDSLKKRGLTNSVSDEDYLRWWQQQLRLE